MQDLINQITELVQSKNLNQQVKNDLIVRLPTLSEENLRDILAALQATSVEELDMLQSKNITKLNELVVELKKITAEGVKLIYKKGEEMNQKKEEQEEEDVLAELQEL